MASQSSQLYRGQIAGLTGTAQRLAPLSQASIREVVVQADPSNTTNVLIGNSSDQTFPLVPGQGLSIPINNVSSIYVKMETGTGIVNWLARD